jgi:hypothetical protein
VNYVRKDSATGDILEEFNLYPDAFLVKGEGGRTQLSANPDSRHYWHKDIFTFVTSMPDPESNKDTASFKNTAVNTGDTVFYSSGYIVVDQVIEANKGTNKDLPLVDSAWLADVTVYSNRGTSYKAQPAMFSKDNMGIPKRDTVVAESLVLQVDKTDKGIELGVKESNAVMNYAESVSVSFYQHFVDRRIGYHFRLPDQHVVPVFKEIVCISRRLAADYILVDFSSMSVQCRLAKITTSALLPQRGNPFVKNQLLNVLHRRCYPYRGLHLRCSKKDVDDGYKQIAPTVQNNHLVIVILLS